MVLDAPVTDARVIRYDLSSASTGVSEAVIRFREDPVGGEIGGPLVSRVRTGEYADARRSSCLPALRDSFVERPRPYTDSEDLEAAGGYLDLGENPQAAFSARIHAAAQALIDEAAAIRGVDTKYDVFASLLRRISTRSPQQASWYSPSSETPCPI